MSFKMISRWKADPTRNLKRQRPEEVSDDDDDEMPLVSHSPSPTSQNNDMDVDEGNIQKYDEYIRKPAREVVTVDTKIKPSNKGFALLTKLGWHEGQPVGLSTEGRTEPVPFYIKSDLTGLGKTNLDFQMIETTVSQRRELDSERQGRETEEQRKVREVSVFRKNALEAEVSSTLKLFFCKLCDKQFKTVVQYDEHTNSYAHHHKARFKSQAYNRKKPQELDIRKEKERKREEKELRQMAAANGIKIPNAQPPALTHIALTDSRTDMGAGATPTEISDKGRIVTSTSNNIPPGCNTSGGFKKTGWAIVGDTVTTSNQPLPINPPQKNIIP